MQRLKSLILYTAVSVFSSTYATNHLHTVFSTPHLRSEFSGFLDEVLRMVPSKDFYKLVDTIAKQQSPRTDEEWYAVLSQSSRAIGPWLPPLAQLKSLAHQKEVLGTQIMQLLPDTPVDGYVEIGTPGTYLSKQRGLGGQFTVVSDKERRSDRMQALSYNPLKKFKAYDNFVALNDHAPIALPGNSVDVVLLVVGLHHIPVEKLDAFIASISRILRPGGKFILRDHNADGDEMISIVSTAHSVFNVLLSGEDLATELTEYRNFQSLQHWIERIEAAGFVAGEQRLLQTGDPTKNTMLGFTKIAQTTQERGSLHSRVLKTKEGYARDLMQSYLSHPEWTNVDVAQEYGAFIEHTPFYEFPYLKSLGAYWRVFFGSLKTAAQKRGKLRVLTSPYTMMNAFIGMTMTVEYLAKSLISAPIRLAYSGEEPVEIELLVHDPENALEQVDSRAKVIADLAGGYKHIAVPRYKEFLSVMRNLAKSSVELVEIAGQQEISLKVRKEVASAWPAGLSIDYEWTLPTQPAHTCASVTSRVESLKETIVLLAEHNIEILYLHDF